ncbi:MAG TPA: hypothetical protein VM243_11930 [Phycisphaerae bacterium]|nr:hypothetical protein [Phycisphaerae bacterium]
MSDDRPATLGDITGVHERLDCVIESLAEGAASTAALGVEVRACKAEIERTRVTLFGRDGNGQSVGILRDHDATKSRVDALERTRRRQVKGFCLVGAAAIPLIIKGFWEWFWG